MNTIGRPTLDAGGASEWPGSDAADEGSDPLIGRLLDDRYRILARLGEGGMGLVYEARHEVLGLRVAIKLLRSDAATDEESIARFEREAQTASAIGNEHIVDVRDFGRMPDGSTYVVMERIDGVDLLTELRREPLSWPRACGVALQICEALGAAHDAGVVHRDLKPENVLLTVRGGTPDFVKIVDFGIAKVIHGGKKLTAAGRVIGTPEYMAPEQCAGRGVDARTDIYALGILLYEMTTGQLPFSDPDLGTLVRQQMVEPPVPPSRVRPEAELPLAFEAVVLRCLAKDPDARFGSMRAVASALERALAGSEDFEPFEEEALGDDHAGRSVALGATTPAPTQPSEERSVPARPTPAGDRVETGPSKVRGVAVLAVIALGLAGGAAVWLAGTPERPTVATTSPQPPGDVTASNAAVASDERPSSAPTERGGASISDGLSNLPVDGASRETRIESDPSEVEVWQGEVRLGSTPLDVTRPEEGERLELSLRRRGYLARSLSLSAQSGARLRVVLEPIPRPAATRASSSAPASPQPVAEPVPSVGASDRSASEPHRPGFLDPWQRPAPPR